MTKIELIEFIESAIDGRWGYYIKICCGGYIRVYANDNIFTAGLITRFVENTREYFIGVSVTPDGRPYLLFSI